MPGTDEVNERLRRLPAMDEVLRSRLGGALLARHPRWAVKAAVRAALEALRERLRTGEDAPTGLDPAGLDAAAAALVRPSLRRVLNATGVVLHTNLGRAPLATRAIDRIVDVARGYSNLEYDLARGARGSRHDHLGPLLAELCGAEAACVVNNNAGAVLLALAALAAGREVVVSRGELVEIGGSFRVPDVMRASGALLREVGTTNKTHPADYRHAIGPATALLLKVHRSNFAIVGFTEEVEPEDLATLGHEAGLPVMMDLGSGCLVDLTRFDLPAEPTVGDMLAAGVDLVTVSGDKLLGGPQAGIICGRAALVAQVRAHPLIRALRPDKLTLAALEATLSLYRDGAEGEIPALALLHQGASALTARAASLAAAIGRHGAGAAGVEVSVLRLRSAVGGGALPLCEPESAAVAVLTPHHGAAALEARLRAQDPPVVGRIAEDRVLLDVRTLTDDDLEEVAQAVVAAAGAAPPEASRDRC
jgi:L-seryl-tRNA(Ser) seleniumtransferase